MRREALFQAFPTHFAFSLFLLRKEIVKLLYQCVCIGAVNGASILDGLASGCGAAQAMHTDCEKELRSFGIVIQNVADDGLFGYYHGLFSPF